MTEAQSLATAGSQPYEVYPIDRGFRVAHQKVSVDVNLADWSLEGWTELTIVPTDPALKQIRLDCRQSRVHNVTINGRKSPYFHQDALRTISMSQHATANQHHHFRHGIEDLLSGYLPGELVLTLPKGVRIVPQDPNSAASANLPAGAEGAFTPLTVKIDFSLTDAKTGVNFVGGEGSNIRKPFWHAYTTHSPIGQSTSSWMPCLDGMWDACTWQIEISVPRTVRDIGKKADAEEKSEDIDEDIALSDAEREELDRDVVVVCNNNPSSEVAHPFDPCKKVVSFDMFTPLSAHHIGFAVGPFVQTPVTDLKDNNEDDLEQEEEDTSTSVPIWVYTFPHMVNDAINTCLFLYKTMEFYTREYGSYPYTSYSIVFVNDSEVEAATAAGLAICSDKLLFSPEVIEPLFTNTELLSVVLANQWSGVNLVPETWNDMWITVGIAHHMANCFIRKLFGNNEHRFRMKRQTEVICEEDIGKPPLAEPEFLHPITEEDLSFIKLKAPVVLFILDRRMTKTDRSLGLSRVLPKLFLFAMSGGGGLNVATINTQQFQKLCEKVGHNQLNSFFDQWVRGSGYPIFRITQRFNKKRMFVEMGIRQVQNAEIGGKRLDEKHFVKDAKMAMDTGKSSYPVQPIFTGPMTIRIHEADGTPYEHVVDLKENFTKLDIQYNTKYKRLKRTKKNAQAAAAAAAAVVGKDVPEDTEENDADLDGVLLHSLGDTLQTDEEIAEWRLTDWTKEEEERMMNEAFEWIRVDSDFEWICKLYINQPDYMFNSQLQQDRDVAAQLEAIRYFGESKPSALYSSILVKTLVDRRYYYGVRVEAANALAKCAVEETGFMGMFHLKKAFQSMFCFENSFIPTANDFSDFTSYFVQKAIPRAISQVRDAQNKCPMEAKNFILDLLRYNENSSNSFSDCYYVVSLIESLVGTLRPLPGADKGIAVDVTPEMRHFVSKAVEEIDRSCRMDAWLPSVQNMVTIATIAQKDWLAREGHIEVKHEELIQYTKCGTNNDVRLAAFGSLLNLGGMKNKALLHYTFVTAAHDHSNYVRYSLIEKLEEVIGIVALNGDIKPLESKNVTNGHRKGGGIDDAMTLDNVNPTNPVSSETAPNGSDHPLPAGPAPSSLLPDNNPNIPPAMSSNPMDVRREQMARHVITTSIQRVRKVYGDNPHLKRQLWTAINDPTHYGIVQKRIMLDISQLLYPAVDSFIVTLPTPRPKRLVAKYLGDGKVVIKREGRLKMVLGLKGKKVSKANGKVARATSRRADDQPRKLRTLVEPPPPPADVEPAADSTPRLKLKLGFKKK
ncbi:transcription initiation factor TFIID subunit 2 [Trichomonascus vanleenenianus]|uniref:transcription initiation factor TFIID subunit TAF2 n=1 Tax=Trichomonascus vanleenenianus TaxID=2268995 RepID=UPI003ECA14F0